ncbi:MAG: hypothetical protein WBK55_05685 [Alphaproteobacteria bacterium]
MLKTAQIQQRVSEKGNVLFLILIAVALFAALSYAVTQSSRSGGGDANNETNLISSAQITQYPSSIRTAIIRMMVSSNTSANTLEFNSPSDFGACTNSNTRCVFHPQGGGATYVLAPEDVVTGSSPQAWVFNGQNEVFLVGTSGGGNNETSTTAEIMAILPNVETSICNRINTELGVGAAAVADTGINIDTNMGTGSGGTWVTALASGGTGGTLGEGAAAALNGQAFGCFSQGGANYYYHVLIEQ